MEAIELMSYSSDQESVFLLEGIPKLLLLAWQLFNGSTALLIRVHYVYFIYKYTPKRPLNVLLAFGQITVAVVILVYSILMFLPVLLSTPMNPLFGGSPVPCFVMRIAGKANFTLELCNGLGLAFYRLSIMNARTLHMGKMISIQSGSAILIALAYQIGADFSNIHTSLNFCSGNSDLMESVLFDYNSKDELAKETGHAIQNVALLVLFGVAFMEFAIYALIAAFRYKQDGSVQAMISAKHLKMRRKANMITLGGQVAIFAIEICGILVTQLFVSAVVQNGTYLLFLVPLESLIIAIAQSLNSPDILRTIFNVPL